MMYTTALVAAAAALAGQAAAKPFFTATDLAARALAARDGGCDNNWDGTDLYDKPADKTQILVTGIASSATREFSITQSWTNGTNFSFGVVGDIFSLGAQFSESFTESKTSSQTMSITVPKGQIGDWGFTPFMQCTKGHGTCGGKTVDGEICWPEVDDEGHIKGQNHLILH